MLHTCRSVARDRDAAMDGYAYVLEMLRADSYGRLRAYRDDGRTRFTTWLVVVVRRLMVDFHRRRYGRPRSDTDDSLEQRLVRRRLEDLVGAELDPDLTATPSDAAPDAGLMQRQLMTALRDAIADLEPADRLLLALRFEDERPVTEIAAVMSLPSVFHVYRRLKLVLAELRRGLLRRGVEEPTP